MPDWGIQGLAAVRHYVQFATVEDIFFPLPSKCLFSRFDEIFHLKLEVPLHVGREEVLDDFPLDVVTLAFFLVDFLRESDDVGLVVKASLRGGMDEF